MPACLTLHTVIHCLHYFCTASFFPYPSCSPHFPHFCHHVFLLLFNLSSSPSPLAPPYYFLFLLVCVYMSSSPFFLLFIVLLSSSSSERLTWRWDRHWLWQETWEMILKNWQTSMVRLLEDNQLLVSLFLKWQACTVYKHTHTDTRYSSALGKSSLTFTRQLKQHINVYYIDFILFPNYVAVRFCLLW